MDATDQVRQAIVSSVEDALTDYLVGRTGEDWPRESQVVLDEYTITVDRPKSKYVTNCVVVHLQPRDGRRREREIRVYIDG